MTKLRRLIAEFLRSIAYRIDPHYGDIKFEHIMPYDPPSELGHISNISIGCPKDYYIPPTIGDINIERIKPFDILNEMRANWFGPPVRSVSRKELMEEYPLKDHGIEIYSEGEL